MYNGLREIDYRLIGWGWMLWDVAPRARLRVRHGVLGFTTIVTDDPHAVCSGDSALQLAGCGGSSHPALHATRSDVSVRRAPSWSVG
jgi:hypothetical protein